MSYNASYKMKLHFIQSVTRFRSSHYFENLNFTSGVGGSRQDPPTMQEKAFSSSFLWNTLNIFLAEPSPPAPVLVDGRHSICINELTR